jgi:tripartite-type tricarboxylate transporter receptor subunit TctC
MIIRCKNSKAGARAAALVAVLAGTAAQEASAQDFYAGKTITFLVGGDVSGGYDIYARAIARHWNRYIAGKPTIIVQNMPGAGSNNAAENIYTIAPKDGTVIGAVFPGAIVGKLLDDKTLFKFDPKQFLYIGTADSGTRVCATWHNSKIKSMADAQKTETVVGASAAGGSTRDYAYLANNLTGTKFKVVSGYKGTAEIGLAVERGELDGLCGFDWTSLKSQKPDWIKNKQLNILVQVALKPEPELTALGVPEFWTFVKPEDRAVGELVISQQVFGRPYILPPGVPADRVKILRESFMATMGDADFKADAAKQRIEITPLSGEEVQKVVEKLYAAPEDVVQRARKVIAPPN